MKLFKRTLAATLLASTMMLGACANGPEDDPIEGWNRGVYKFNEAIDQAVFSPVAKGYRYITPEEVRNRVGNFSDNLREPLTMINALLQGDIDRTMTSFWRFVINSTVGLLGIHDVAGEAGLKERREDFGQTLGVWGAGEGAYIVLPIFGPSNGRDVIGKVADWFMDPFHYYLETDDKIWIGVGQGLVERERLIETFDDVYENSLDPYTSFKSMYTQHRRAQIENTHSNLDTYDEETPAEVIVKTDGKKKHK